jgi:hypothetical protein
MTETLTGKQRVGWKALEGAQRAGVSLSDYAKAKGLELRPVYDAIATLRRRGVLPRSDRPLQAQEQVCSGAAMGADTPAALWALEVDERKLRGIWIRSCNRALRGR